MLNIVMPSKDPVLYYIQNADVIKATSKAHYKQNKNKYSCDYCKKTLCSKQSVKRHMKTCMDKPK